MEHIDIQALMTADERLVHLCAIASGLSHNRKPDATLEEDLKLLSTLVKNGDEHAKSVRGLLVTYLIVAPRYFYHEFVTYKVGHEQLGSESTMHFAPKFENENDFLAWKHDLKEGTTQMRIFMTSYQTLRRMYFQRRNHRLPEWREFCAWIETLPYAKELITIERK